MVWWAIFGLADGRALFDTWGRRRSAGTAHGRGRVNPATAPIGPALA